MKQRKCLICGEDIELIEVHNEFLNKTIYWFDCSNCGLSTGQYEDEHELYSQYDAVRGKPTPANCMIQPPEAGGLT